LSKPFEGGVKLDYKETTPHQNNPQAGGGKVEGAFQIKRKNLEEGKD